jgi:hypothetical protein
VVAAGRHGGRTGQSPPPGEGGAQAAGGSSRFLQFF